MSRKKQRGEDFKREDILQAVVICDSFNLRFAPLTKDRPKALLPLGNIPLLDYTLEFLCTAGIQEVILFCVSHVAAIRAHLNQSKWVLPTCPMDIVVIVSENCMSVGDALRDIDAKSLIHNDFVLVNADVVGSIKLQPLIAAHKHRRLTEKTAVMTLLMKHAPPRHPTRCCRNDEIALATHASRVFSFKKLPAIHKLHVPLELLKQYGSMQVRHDLLDCQVAICSPLVPQLFTDNFDYQSREDFIKGILENEEILGNTIHLHVLEDAYAARVTTHNMYDAVSRDLLSRWNFPIVPDSNITDRPDDAYSYTAHHIYKHRDVTLARGCVLQQGVLIGKDTQVGSNTIISNSTIGKNCTIGENVRLEGAYLWDGVVIEDNCHVTSSILANDVHLKSGVTVPFGCVLADEVIVGPDIALKQGTVLSLGNDVQDEAERVAVVGVEGRGQLYCPCEDDSDDSDVEDADLLAPELMGLRLDDEEEDDDDDELSDSSDDNSDGDDDAPGSPPPDEFNMFAEEVIGTLERAVAENIGLDNMILEINSLKHGYGIQIKEVNHLVTKAILELPFKVTEVLLSPNEYLTMLVTNFKKMMPVLKNYIRSEASQTDCLNSIEMVCTVNATVSGTIVKLLHYLYNAEVLTEEVIIAWYKQPPLEENRAESIVLRKQVTSFITWLEEAEEEDSEDESD